MRYLLTLFALLILSSCSLNRNKNTSITCSKYYDKDLKMDVYTSADDIPLYMDEGIKFSHFLIRNFKSREWLESMERMIKITFILDDTGKIRNAGIKDKEVKDYTEAETEVIRVLNLMPKWKPATCKGKKVAFLYYIPLRMEPGSNS